MSTLKQFGLFAILVFTWIALFFALTFFTELIMSPWDAAIHIPELGTWQRSLNDFFQFSVGKYILSVPLILLSIAVNIYILRMRPDMIGKLIAGNVLFFGALIVLFMFGAAINNNILFPYPPVAYDPNYRGFHRSIFPMAVILIACLVWFNWQRRIQPI